MGNGGQEWEGEVKLKQTGVGLRLVTSQLCFPSV